MEAKKVNDYLIIPLWTAMRTDLEGFKSFLTLQDRSKATVAVYVRSIKLILSSINSFDEIDSFFAKLKEEGKSGAYLNTLVFSLRLYAKFKNLPELQKYHAFKVKSQTKATFSDEEIEKFLSVKVPYKFESSKLKWEMFWKLVALTGARCGEISHLRKNSIDWGRGVMIVNGKTGERIVPIPPNLSECLKIYLKSIDDYLFPSKGHDQTGAPVLGDSLWNDDFKKRLTLIDVSRPRLTPHSFRHSFGTTIWEETKDLYSVKELLGHKKLETTLIYTHLSTKSLQESQERHRLIRKSSAPIVILKTLITLIRSFKIENDSRFNYRLEENDHSLRFEVYIK